eukprot:symbB.v1.2.003540.t1/scaffold196.1/size274459/12
MCHPRCHCASISPLHASTRALPIQSLFFGFDPANQRWDDIFTLAPCNHERHALNRMRPDPNGRPELKRVVSTMFAPPGRRPVAPEKGPRKSTGRASEGSRNSLGEKDSSPRSPREESSRR